MFTETEKVLGMNIHVLAKTVEIGLNLQAHSYRMLAEIHPTHSEDSLTAAKGLETGASGLNKMASELARLFPLPD